MKLKKLIAAVTCLGMVLSLSACGGNVSAPKETSVDPESKTEADQTAADAEGETGSDVDVTLQLCTHYAGNGESPNVDYAIEKVKEKYPNVKFEIDVFPQDGGQSLKARAATGSLPDIIWLNSGLIEPLAKSGSLVQLDSYIGESGFKDTLNAAVQEYCMKSSDGHMYMYSVEGVQPLVWYYNKEVFEQNGVKVPENYDELLSAVQQFQKKGIIPMALFGKEPWPLGAFFEAFAMRENPEGLRPLAEGRAKASDQEYQKAIEKMTAVIEAGMFQKGVTNADHDTAFALFTAGEAAMFQNGSWAINDMNEKMGDKVDYFTSYPTNDAGNDANKNAFAGGGDTVGYGVSATTSDVDLAADIARILAQAQAEYDYVNRNSVGSAVDTSKIAKETPLPPLGEKMATEIPNMQFESTMLQNFPNTVFATGFAEEMQKLLVGETTEEFIANLDRLIDSY